MQYLFFTTLNEKKGGFIKGISKTKQKKETRILRTKPYFYKEKKNEKITLLLKIANKKKKEVLFIYSK